MIDFTSILPIAAGIGVIALLAALISLFSNTKSRASERLDEFQNPLLRKGVGDLTQRSSSVGNMFERAAPTLSSALQPKSDLEKNNLKLRLANAGYNSPAAPSIFLAIKFLGLLLGGVLGTSIGLGYFGLTQNGYTTIAATAGLCFYLPELSLSMMVKSRKEKIFLSLPDALDLLVVCVEAGLGLDAAMRRVCEEIGDSAPELAKEFETCNFQLQVGKARRDVLHDLGIRSGVDDLRSLSAILIQADRFGASVAQALRVQSDSMRVKRRQIAEEKAQQTAVKMIFPLVLFIFPGIFVVLVGPAAIMMINQLLNKPQ